MGVIKRFKVGQRFTYSDGLDYIIDNIKENSLTKDEISLIELGLIDERKYYDKIKVKCSCVNKIYASIFIDLETLYKEIEKGKCMESYNINGYYSGNDKITTSKINCATINNTFSSDTFKRRYEEYIGYTLFNMKPIKNPTLSAPYVKPDAIVDYEVINNTVVIFTFADGTTEKTVCNHEFDEFELWRAVELAICKKKFGGTKAYHNAVNNAIKQIENIDAKKKAEEEEKERIANRKAKYQQRKAKRMAKKRQEQIDIQTEAFYKAMMMYDETQLSKDVESSDEDVAANTPVETDETK